MGRSRRAAHEEPEDTIRLIDRYIVYTHCKDSIVDDAGEVRYALMGEGTLPWRRMLDLLRAEGYDGYLTLEWEKRWHMDLPEPDVAFPTFVRVMREYLATA